MARISDAVLQGLMNPQFNFTGLAEPIGMLMGGAQAQRQAQQRQMGAIQGALGAQDIGGLQGVLGGLRTPEEAQTALSAYGAGQQARAQQAQLSAQEAARQEEIRMRSSAIQQALQKGDPQTATMLRDAPISVVSDYVKTQITDKPEDELLVVGNYLYDTKKGTWVEKPAEPPEQGEWKKLSDGVLYNTVTGETKQTQGAPAVSTEKLVGELASTDNIISTLERAQQVSETTNQITYDFAKFFPLTGARDLAGFVDTIQANLAFDRLDQMRKDSKTGGALGSIAVAELNLLQRSLQALDPGSSSFNENLSNVLKHYKSFRSTLLGQNPDPSKYVISENKVYIKGAGENQWVLIGEAK